MVDYKIASVLYKVCMYDTPICIIPGMIQQTAVPTGMRHDRVMNVSCIDLIEVHLFSLYVCII